MITDGAAGNVPSGVVEVAEPVYAAGTALLVPFTVEAGSDNLLPASIVFSPEQLDLLDSLSLNSAGVPVTFSLANADQTLRASAGGNTVFDIDLSATLDAATGNLDATATLNQLLPLDHIDSEALYIPVSVQASDIDGTVASAASLLIIDDGPDPASTAEAGTISEDALASSAVLNGDLEITIGSDSMTDIGFLSEGQPNASSGGVELQYQVSADGLTLTAYTVDPLDPVFTTVIAAEPAATADSTLAYQFTLLKALDQLDAQGQPIAAVELDLRYQALDFDGDAVEAGIPISVTDGSSATGGDIDIQLTEVPRKLANISVPDSTEVDFGLTAVFDPIVSTGFDIVSGSTVLDDAGNAVTHSGEILSWSFVSPSILQARTDSGVTALELELPDDLFVSPDDPATVPLKASVLVQFDHLDSGVSTDNLTIPVGVNFEDSDGSQTRLVADISIYDGRDPIVTSATTLTVDEDDLASNAASDSGLGYGLIGSDNVVSFAVTLDSVVSSGGAAVTLAGTPDAEGWWIASTGAGEVFRFKVDLAGITDVSLSRPIDHSPPGNNGENIQAINLGVAVIDADGDSSNIQTQIINVVDDVPVDGDFSRDFPEGAHKTVDTLGAGEAGADGGEITEARYVNPSTGLTEIYVVPSGSQIEFDLYTDTGVVYGLATVRSAGKITVETAVSLSASFDDSLDFLVTDADGDVETNTLFINVIDEQAFIDISPLETREDTALTLSLVANPGDLDQNEEIIAISFIKETLADGILLLDGVPLPLNDDDDPVLAGDDLIVTDPATMTVVPNGVLTFQPRLNSSDTTDTVLLDPRVTVDTDSGLITHVYKDKFEVMVEPVVDLPVWDPASVFNYTMAEDGAGPAFSLAANLFDDDSSETLAYRIENIEAGIELRANGQVVNDGDQLTEAEFASLTLAADENLSGQFSFEAVAISEERDTGDQAEVSRTVTVDVTPEADTPNVSTSNVYMLEDSLVSLSTFVSGVLADTDSSESLFFDLDLPTGWMITDASGVETGLVSPGTYRVSDADVQADRVYLKPLEDISSASGGVFQLSVSAVAVESAVDGVTPSLEEAASAPRTVNVEVEGVVDSPTVGPGPDGAWSFDGSTISGSFIEDSLIPLNFTTGTEDDDASEVFDFTLEGVPQNVTLVDASGDPANLDVAGTDAMGRPIYSVTSAQLAALQIKLEQDFSGQILFQINQTNTEPDGDSATFSLPVDITVTPVVDSADGISDTSTGAEDAQIALQITPALADVDGSETLTNAVITSLPSGVTILLDQVPLTIPVGGLDIDQLASDNGTDFDTLINSGRLTVQAPEDSDQDFSLPVIFEVTDTSPLAATAVASINGSLQVRVSAQVDDDAADGITRIETTGSVVSTDGSPISLTGAAQFIEADIDGSEYLDYLSVSIPEVDGWFVTHPQGAIHDGNGNWLIPAGNLTSETLVDAMAELLDAATIVSDHVADLDIAIKARVLDRNDDADIISSTINVDFQVAGATGTATAVSGLQTSITDGLEAEDVDFTGHIDTGAAGDGNDVVSFRIDVADMPQGGAVTGTGVITEYADDGTSVVAYVFSNASLPSLQISGMDEDFAGAVSVIVHKISTDPRGDTLVTTEPLQIELQPVVDTPDTPPVFSILEDVPTPMAFDPTVLLNDNDVVAAEGIESITAIRFLAMAEGSISDPSNILVDNGDGSFTLNDVSRLDEIYYIPPSQQHGRTSFDVEMTVQDQTTGLTLGDLDDTVSSTFPITVEIDVIAITDVAPVTAADSIGLEDSDIALSLLMVVDIDDDGSESLTMQLSGLPSGAVLFWNDGGNLVQLKNDGADGMGGFGWTFSPDQIDDLVLRPPRDFAGDIDLVLQSTSMELSTQEVVTETAKFSLGVLPDADGASFFRGAEDVSGEEGTPVAIGVYAEVNEAVNPNETIVVNVIVKAGSDDSARLGLVGIQAPDGSFAAFANAGLHQVASLRLAAAQLETLLLIAGDDAFGDLQIDIEVGSFDSAVVAGKLETDESSPAELQVKSLVVSLAPEPDPPMVDLRSSEIHSGVGEVPLGIGLTPVNPAPGETSQIVISGIPEGVNLSAGSQSGTLWIVEAVDVDGLAIENGAAGEVYDLSIEPRSTLDGDTVSGGKLSLAVTMAASLNGDNTLDGNNLRTNLLLGGDGDDTLSGGLLEDTYLFRLADTGAVGDPALDVIYGFDADTTRLDKIDLSDIAAGLDNGAALAAIIDIDEFMGDTTLSIDLGAGAVQDIRLDGVTRDDLYDGNGWMDDADILQKMLDDQILLTG